MSVSLSFAQWLFSQGRHKNTVALHLKKLRVIKRKLNKINYSNCLKMISSMKEGGYSNATINHYVGTMRLYGVYKNIPELNNLKFFSKKSALKGTLSDEEIENFINLPRPPNINKDCWELFSLWLEVLAYTGCRPGEAANLTINDIDFGRNVIIFKYTKTDEPRVVGIAPRLAEHLKEHVSKCENYLFLTKQGQVYSDHSWLHRFNNRKKILGIKRNNITPMSFRHSFATRMLEKDVNIYKVAKILGHDIKMTQQYEHLTVEDVKTAMNKHPLIKKQIKFSKQEVIKILSEVLNDIGLVYETKLKNEHVLLKIRCP
jgi:integrase